MEVLYTFTVMELRTVKLQNGKKTQKLWLIAVAAPELENLRTKYGLQPLLKGHDFHITLGTQVPGKVQPINEALQFEEFVEQVEFEEAA
jgi:hypothetical protein